ncbi:MAG: methyltransferase [Armatimonadia bacterium]|nr:methyltransferase [Armatimonadia bacterium]
MKPVTSRERVLAAIEHREPDRVPVDLGAMRSTGIMAMAYARLREHLGIRSGEVFMYDVVQGLAQPEDVVLDRFGIDVADLARAFLTEADERRPFRLMDGTPASVPAWFQPEDDGEGGYVVRDDTGRVIGAMPATQPYITQTYHPLADGITDQRLADLPEHMGRVTWGGLATAPWHLPQTPTSLERIAETAKEFRASTDRAIMVAVGCNLLEWGQFLRGFGLFLEDLAADPQGAHKLLDRLVEVHLETIDRALPAIGPHVDILQMGDDLGTQAGPQISPSMYRTFFKDRHTALYARAREVTGAKIFLHSCGGIAPLLPDLIEAGVEIINPVQTNAAGMEPERLKREFGRDLCFWGGGVDTQDVLRSGTPDQVRAQVMERKRIFGEGGGFVFCQIHNILSDVPPENVVAMLEAAGGG